MKIYLIGNKKVLLHEGEIFVQADELIESAVRGEGEVAQYKTPKKLPKVLAPKKWSGRGKRLSPEVREAIEAGIIAGTSEPALVAEFSVSSATIYNIKSKLKASGKLPTRLKKGKSMTEIREGTNRNKYECDYGHKFVSNLGISHARCPVCKSTNLMPDTEQPVEEE